MTVLLLGVAVVSVFLACNLVLWFWLLWGWARESIRDQNRIDERLHDMIRNERK